MSLTGHSPFPAPGFYATLTSQEEVEKLTAGLWSIVGVSWIYMHFTSLFCLDTNPPLLAGDVLQQIAEILIGKQTWYWCTTLVIIGKDYNWTTLTISINIVLELTDNPPSIGISLFTTD